MQHALLSPSRRRLDKLILLLFLLALLAAAAPVPFVWESQTLWYKFGLDKILLQAGKTAGIFAALLLALQIILASRQPLLDRIFGLDRLYFFHQVNGFMVVIAGLIHFGLVILPEGLANLPLGWKFWPEMTGGAVLLLLMLSTLLSTFRPSRLSYGLWRLGHRPLGYALALALPVHIFFVSTTFDYAVPRYALFALVGAVATMVIGRKIVIFRRKNRGWQLGGLFPVSDEVISVEVQPPADFTHAAGQFAFIEFGGGAISAEPHPFTIASAPTDTTLQFVVKQCGDWTRRLQPDAAGTIKVEGPYGLFSYQAWDETDDLVLIAGGIGITPLLSMLRQIASDEVQPRVTLIWSLRHRRQMFLAEELMRLQERIPRLTIHQLYTAEDEGGRPGRHALAAMLGDFTATTRAFICGPPPMMQTYADHLIGLGFSARQIHRERFSL